MSGLSVTVDDAVLKAALSGLQRALADARPAMEAIGQLLVTETDLAFRGQRDPWGAPWPGLSQVTLKRRRKGPREGAPVAQILADTGRLRGSITYRAGRHAVAVGTNVIYAATHQMGAARGAFGRTRRGGPIPWGRIPARPFLPLREGRADLPPGLQQDVIALIARHIERASHG